MEKFALEFFLRSTSYPHFPFHLSVLFCFVLFFSSLFFSSLFFFHLPRKKGGTTVVSRRCFISPRLHFTLREACRSNLQLFEQVAKQAIRNYTRCTRSLSSVLVSPMILSIHGFLPFVDFPPSLFLSISKNISSQRNIFISFSFLLFKILMARMFILSNIFIDK